MFLEFWQWWVTSCYACDSMWVVAKVVITHDECGCGPNMYVWNVRLTTSDRNRVKKCCSSTDHPSYMMGWWVLVHSSGPWVSSGQNCCCTWVQCAMLSRWWIRLIAQKKIQAFRFVSITSRKLHINSRFEQMGFSNNVFSRLESMLAELNHLVKIAVHEFVQYCRDSESDCVIRKRSDSIKFLSIKSEAFT
jgi:hypothetical protein